MNKLPIKIDPCPIQEAILEVRYSSQYPNEAILGMFYGKIGNFFEDPPISLPILQLPEAVRRQDPALKYKAYHQFKKGSHTLNIGPDVLTFSTNTPYSGWEKWSDFFYEVLARSLEANVINKVERLGLRYINHFNDNIFEKIHCEVDLIGRKLKNESTNLRTEEIDGDFIKVLQIGNSVTMVKGDQSISGSVIDIDILYNIKNTKYFLKNYKEVVESAHSKEKELFFALMKETFLEEFNPIYGE